MAPEHCQSTDPTSVIILSQRANHSICDTPNTEDTSYSLIDDHKRRKVRDLSHRYHR
ncbi:hypothetical protein POX_a01555 [Penicillium oxalicum]|uniref:hypothetical protein n=1 Tax=Penicillium oxalicum TaxID=69781 RepID=UPI0020B7624D|nr:hypothetical protein POX_a01555 [Penicillium oxalicum]KAI2794954.1 hypothetical protein POX_a01555 [Penicillium oxalicum]